MAKVGPFYCVSDESRVEAQRRVCFVAFIRSLFGLIGLVTTLAAPPSISADTVVRIGETHSPSSDANGSATGNSTDSSYTSKFAARQISKLKEVLRRHHKGAVNFLWLVKNSAEGEQVASAFRDAGWVVASLPIGMGNLPPGITITGETNNISVAAARAAFDGSGIIYHFRNDETTTIVPSMMGPCDVVITFSTESK